MMELDPRYASVIVKRYYQNFPSNTIMKDGAIVQMGEILAAQ